MSVNVLTVKEVAERLRCDTATIYRLIAAGKLRAINLSVREVRKTFRVSEDALADFLAESETANPVPSANPPSRQPSLKRFKHMVFD